MLPVDLIELEELLLGASQADLETFDLAEPAFRLGFGDSGDQIVADLGKPCPLGRVRSEERASDTSFSELALAGADHVSSEPIAAFRARKASSYW